MVRETLGNLLRDANTQLAANREAKQNLEADWSDKVKREV